MSGATQHKPTHTGAPVWVGLCCVFNYVFARTTAACTPIKLDPHINFPDAWTSYVALPMLTVFHSPRCNEMWMQYSVCAGTEISFLISRMGRLGATCDLDLWPLTYEIYMTQFLCQLPISGWRNHDINYYFISLFMLSLHV